MIGIAQRSNLFDAKNAGFIIIPYKFNQSNKYFMCSLCSASVVDVKKSSMSQNLAYVLLGRSAQQVFSYTRVLNLCLRRCIFCTARVRSLQYANTGLVLYVCSGPDFPVCF